MDFLTESWNTVSQKAAAVYENFPEFAEAVWVYGGVQTPEGFLPFGFALLAISFSIVIVAVSWFKFRQHIVEWHTDKVAPVIGDLYAKFPASPFPSPSKSTKDDTPKKASKETKKAKSPASTKKRNATPVSMKKSPAPMKSKSPAMKKKA